MTSILLLSRANIRAAADVRRRAFARRQESVIAPLNRSNRAIRRVARRGPLN
jgi:hypothetical protein